MKFKNCQLIINSQTPQKNDIKKIYDVGLLCVKDYGSDLYEIHKEFIEDRFLWLYCEYDNSQLYNETVLNKDNDEKEANPRTKSQVELRKQLFVCYDTNTNLLYMSNIDKRGFVKYYISDTLQKDVDTKNIYASLEDFQNTVKRIKALKFVQEDNIINRMPDSIFQQHTNIYGFDCPSKVTMQVEYSGSPISELENTLQNFKMKKNAGEFESIIVVGYDDDDVEQSFDFSSIMKAVEILANKNENSRFNQDEVRDAFLEKIR